MADEQTPLRYEDAAERVTIHDASGKEIGSAWRTVRSGQIWELSSEHHARWCDATDLPCRNDCGARVTKVGYATCDACRAKQDESGWVELYAKAREWDGKTPLCTYKGERFLWDADSVADYISDELSGDATKARLVLCKPDNGQTFEMSEFLCDSMHEDSDLDDSEINKTVNDWIKANAPFSWWATDTPVKVESLVQLYQQRAAQT